VSTIPPYSGKGIRLPSSTFFILHSSFCLHWLRLPDTGKSTSIQANQGQDFFSFPANHQGQTFLRSESRLPRLRKITKRTHLGFFDLPANKGKYPPGASNRQKNEPISALVGRASPRAVRFPSPPFFILHSPFFIGSKLDNILLDPYPPPSGTE